MVTITRSVMTTVLVRLTTEDRMQLAQRLVHKGILSDSDLPRVAEAQLAAPTKPLHELLIERGFAKELEVLAALAEELGLDLVDLTNVTVEPETLAAMPLKLV